ncbi:unnamed protein product [Haemonchus placei]|uniref:Integrase_H2C2 domain-containing protein n=1 Tax=Haemonchus placei TaxID=6290 RepID=A0A0N4X8Q3_HAEPC|nr:unnamed protein product [Haemonchus placei]
MKSQSGQITRVLLDITRRPGANMINFLKFQISDMVSTPNKKFAQATLSQERLLKLINSQLYKNENGFVRCRGRIRAKTIVQGVLRLISLPETHSFTDFIVEDNHNRCGHQRVTGISANLRLNYWIPKGRQTVVFKILQNSRKWEYGTFLLP